MYLSDCKYIINVEAGKYLSEGDSMKRRIALVLAAVMVIAMSYPASAEDLRMVR